MLSQSYCLILRIAKAKRLLQCKQYVGLKLFKKVKKKIFKI